MKRSDIPELENKARELRKTVLRMLANAGSGHTGGSLSLVEILMILYMFKMRHDPKKPDSEERDRLVLSKGHGCSALYAVLAEAGEEDGDPQRRYHYGHQSIRAQASGAERDVTGGSQLCRVYGRRPLEASHQRDR